MFSQLVYLHSQSIQTKMMNYTKLLFVVAIILLQWQGLRAQTDYRMSLNRSGTDAATETIQLSNGNVLVAGNTQNGVTPTSGQDGFLMEINPTTQEIIWSQAYHVGATDNIQAVIEASNGDIIAGGDVLSSGTITDKWFLRVNSQGQLLNSSTFGRDNRTSITDIVESVNGDNGQPTFIITGPTTNFNDVYAARIRQDGNVVWLREYRNIDSWTYSATEASDGTIYLSGSANAELEICFLSLDAAGGIIHSDTYDNDLNEVGGVRRMLLIDDQTVVVVGGSRTQGRTIRDARPFFMVINPITRVVTVSRYYMTTAGTYHDVLDVTPTYSNGVHDGYLLLFRHDETTNETRYAKVDLAGEMLSYVNFPSTEQIGKIQALADQTTAIHISGRNGVVNINRFPITNLSSCMDTAPLSYTDTTTTRDTIPATVAVLATTTNFPTTTEKAIDWAKNSQCCISGDLVACCPDTLLTLSTDTSICLGETVALTAGTTTASANITYEWSTGATTATLNVSPMATTTYTVVVTDTVLGCTDSAQVVVTVWNDLAGASLTAVADTCSNTLIDLVAFPSNAANYDWSTGLSNNANIQTVLVAFGNNNYGVNITDANGCTENVTTVVEGVSCCQVTASSTDYVQLDPDNPDTRLAQYGIVRYSNSRSYIMSNESYNRMPERMRFADNVLLYVRTAANAATPTVMDITNADLVFNHNSGIVVEARSKIIANNAVLRPCDDRGTWNGVVVKGRTGSPINTVSPYLESNISFKECTFVNAAFGLSINGFVKGSVNSNLFQNCNYGTVFSNTFIDVSLTNNTYSIDDNALGLTYGSGTISLFGGAYFSTIGARYSIDHLGIGFYGNGNDRTSQADAIVSHNTFVNAMTLRAPNNPHFNGILMSAVNGINVSDNRFTNNDAGAILHYSQDVSLENNHFEVTRLSSVDESLYQIVIMGPPNSSPGSTRAIIKGNTIVNSADVEDLTVTSYLNPNTNVPYLIQGTGGIYNFGNNLAKIIDNDIRGFEVGIYIEHSIATHVTKNKIEAHVYGIYTKNSSGFIACNEIDMDLDAGVANSANVGVVGIYNFEEGLYDYTTRIFGNCVRNTDRAIFVDNARTGNLATSPIYTGNNQVQNNYLFNYTEAGLFVNDMIGAAPDNIRRNAFISNHPTGSGSFDIITEYESVLGNLELNIAGNYYGTDAANFLTTSIGGAYDIDIVFDPNADALIPFTACGNMDAGAVAVAAIEADWLTLCSNENAMHPTAIAQRTAQGTQLVGNYHTVLTDLSTKKDPILRTVVLSSLQNLTNLADVQAVYQVAQNLDLSVTTQQWVEASYQERNGDFAAALQAISTLETPEASIKKAQLTIASTGALNNVALQADLEDIATTYSSLRHEAREILHGLGQTQYTFGYNPISLYEKTAPRATTTDLIAKGSSMMLFPNPTNDVIKVQLQGDKAADWTTAELYDLHGRLIKSQLVRANQLRFDVSELAPSVYFITLKADNGAQTTEKFVKQ